MLFHDKPLFSLKPKAFGYACFVHILPLRPDKLSAKSVRCVFLGYAQNQKGYYCYNTTLKKAFISIDVISFEDIPFYSSSTSSSCPTLYALPVIDVPSSSPKRHADPPIVYTCRLITDPSSLPPPFSAPRFDDPPLVYAHRHKGDSITLTTPAHSQPTDSGIAPSSSTVIMPTSLPTSIPADLNEALKDIRWRTLPCLMNLQLLNETRPGT